jgi:aminomethyltransferase
MAVRQKMGCLTSPHGEVRFEGPDALKNLNRLMTNDFSGMAVGQVRYSPDVTMPAAFWTISSSTAWRRRIPGVVNASNREKDVLWMKPHRFATARCPTCSRDDIAQLALQGPGAKALIAS